MERGKKRCFCVCIISIHRFCSVVVKDILYIRWRSKYIYIRGRKEIYGIRLDKLKTVNRDKISMLLF